jgi:hypothetical protein
VIARAIRLLLASGFLAAVAHVAPVAERAALGITRRSSTSFTSRRRSKENSCCTQPCNRSPSRLPRSPAPMRRRDRHDGQIFREIHNWALVAPLPRPKRIPSRFECRALVRLLTAGLAHVGNATVVGDAAGGRLWLPPAALWANWAWKGLEESLARTRKRRFPEASLWTRPAQ